jgi:hypothetical protein
MTPELPSVAPLSAPCDGGGPSDTVGTVRLAMSLTRWPSSGHVGRYPRRYGKRERVDALAVLVEDALRQKHVLELIPSIIESAKEFLPAPADECQTDVSTDTLMRFTLMLVSGSILYLRLNDGFGDALIEMPYTR